MGRPFHERPTNSHGDMAIARQTLRLPPCLSKLFRLDTLADDVIAAAIIGRNMYRAFDR